MADELLGDTTVTASINLIYSPVAPALPWQAGTFYPAGSIVIPNTARAINGHYYVALKSGVSNAPPGFNEAAAAAPVQVFDDGPGGLTWEDMGKVKVYPAPAAWQAGKNYADGTPVVPITLNGYYYKAHGAANAGTKEPAWPVQPGGTVQDGPKLYWGKHGPYRCRSRDDSELDGRCCLR